MPAVADIKSNWSLFAIVALILGVLVYILYKSGTFSLANAVTSSLGDAASNVGDLTSSITEAPSTLLGGSNAPVMVNVPGVGQVATPGNSSLLWTGVKNLFSTGSIYGNQGSTGN